MNGTTTNGQASSSGARSTPPIAEADQLGRIQLALQTIHNPHSSNEARKEASKYLEEVKNQPDAPYHGFRLAQDHSQQPVVRHYALSLLEYAVKYKWAEYTDSEAEAVRGWIIALAEDVSQTDPLYLRNKTSQLWVEIAKKTWADQWMNMDELLVKLWEVPNSTVHKEFVLFILENLSEEIFNSDDATVAMREDGILSRACVETFTSSVVLSEVFPNRQNNLGVRYGDEGWLIRLGHFFNHLVDNNLQSSEQSRTSALKTLAVFRSCFAWAIPTAIASSNSVHYIRRGLAVPNVPVQTASVEALHTLYSRGHFSSSEFLNLISPMCTTESVDLLRKLYEWSIVPAHDIDEEKYLLSKKLSEMMSHIGTWIDEKSSTIPEDCDFPNLLNLFLSIVQSESFVVSIPVLVTWTRLLSSEVVGGSMTIDPLIAPLLDICSSRLIRYENLPEESNDSCLLFLMEDLDTIPERHAFLGNYRRYSVLVIEQIVRRRRAVAIYHILSNVTSTLEQLYSRCKPFSVEGYSKSSDAVLLADGQCAAVDALLKGYMRWRAAASRRLKGDGKERAELENNFEVWCDQILGMKFEDPLIRKRVLQMCSAFCTTALDNKPSYMLRVLESILMIPQQEEPDRGSYSDAVRELQIESLQQLSRLAAKMPNQLSEVYPQLEAKVNDIISSNSVDSKQVVAYQTFLFIIVLRSTNIDESTRKHKIESFINPLQRLWQNTDLDVAVSSFGNFCNLLGFAQVPDYLVSRGVHKVSDWSTLPLDAEGQAIQAELTERVKALPLRATKAFLGASTEKVEKSSPLFGLVCSVWHEVVPIVLPGLLKFLSNAHAFHNPDNWSSLPPDMKSVVGRILTDRFWQAGISAGSKDDFYARVTGTKSTMEGFASSIRGSVRAIRDSCYAILYGMSRLDVHFYGFEELPGPLAHALFADALFLSSHQLINLLNLVRFLVDDCPVAVRSHFVPPLLATCFAQMDTKISSEWEKLDQKQLTASDEEDLTEEMKEESILRQLTHSGVMLVVGLLDPARPGESVINTNTTNKTSNEASEATATAPDALSMRQFCISQPKILEPLLQFMVHAIRMRDTRSCGIIIRVFRSLIPEFTQSTSLSYVREFISSEVLKACITSLHEPYFVDLHKELAMLISKIIVFYAPHSPIPKEVLMSLPGMYESSVNKCIDYLLRPALQERQQRALVLDLLKEVKGVSINEQGRIPKSAPIVRKDRTKMQMEFMKAAPETVKRQGSPDLEGVSGMFAFDS